MASDSNKATGDRPAHLDPSELGTKEYWESFYENSLSHLSSKKNRPEDQNDEEPDEDKDGDYDSDNDSDPGTSWFSEYKAPEKVLGFLTSETFPLAPCNTNIPPNDAQPTILDLGTGNGSMLTLLRDKGGFTRSRMVGLDYSEKSVELARKLLERSAGEQSQGGSIRFDVYDIFASRPVEEEEWFLAAEGGFDIVLDKGTFDAVSLSAEEVPAEGQEAVSGKDKSSRIQQRICELYPAAATRLVKLGGFLVVTSCNWTEDELVKWFTATYTAESELSVWGRVEYQKFRFGGQEGQGVCTVCFQRKKR